MDTQSKFCLTTDHLYQFHRDGFTAVHGFASATDIDQTRELLMSLFERFAEPRQRVLGGCLQLDRRLVRAQCFKKIRGIAQQLLGPEARFRYDQVFFKHPYSNWATQWHQDDAFAHNPGNPTLKATFWLPLQDVTLESGCLQFIPGSHKAKLLPHYPITQGILSPLVTDCVDTARAVPCPITAGDITIHHGRTLHYAGPNTTDSPRMAWAVEFTAGGSSPGAQLMRVIAPMRQLAFGWPSKPTLATRWVT